MDSPEAIVPQSPLASADDPPPSPRFRSSRTDVGPVSVQSSDISMSWTEVGDEWCDHRKQSGGGSAPSASSPDAVASELAARYGSAEALEYPRVEREANVLQWQSVESADSTAHLEGAETASAVRSYEGASPAAWSRRSSFGSSTESQDAIVVPERAEEGDADDGDSIEHMRLSFPDPISSSSSALASHGPTNPADASELDSELAESDTIDEDEAPPVGLGGEYSLLLDTVGPPSDSTGASAASMSDASSQASHLSSVPPSPSSNASRQLAAIHSDLESPVKLASGAATHTKSATDTEGSRSTSPLLSLRSLPSTPPPFRTAGPNSGSTQRLESHEAEGRTSEMSSAKLLNSEQQDGWRNPTVYDEKQVQAWLHTASLSGACPEDARSEGARGGEQFDAPALIGTTEAAPSGTRLVKPSTVEPDLSTIQAMSASTTNAPRSMASSTATIVPLPLTSRTNDEVAGSGMLPGAMPMRKSESLRADEDLADDDSLQDTVAGHTPARPNPTRSRRTIALLSVASAALAIALAGWAHPQLPAHTSPQHETAATASPIAQVPIASSRMTFSETLEALLIQTVPRIGLEASHWTTVPAEQTLGAAASQTVKPDPGDLCQHEIAGLDLSRGSLADSSGAEATEDASPPAGGWKAAKAFPFDTLGAADLAELAQNGRETPTSNQACRCRELRRERRRRERLLSRSLPSTPPSIASGSHDRGADLELTRRTQSRSGPWSDWVVNGAQLRTAADLVGARASALVAAAFEQGGNLVTSAARGRRKFNQQVDKQLDATKARFIELSRRAQKAQRRYENLCQRSPGLPECKPYRSIATIGHQLREATGRAQRSLPKWDGLQAVARAERRTVKQARCAVSDVYAGFRPFMARHTKRLAKQARRAQPLAYRGGQETVRYAHSVARAFKRQEKLLQKRFAKGEKRDGKRQRRRDKRAGKHA
ncbi:hypothetical protein BMF94_3150 [Rhodotorula taiwanensis]|uniref:Uncharacterized protein n=1 Tax=Rhodotorula taiwanensis TaxID=741276 RepID=A0A2S5BA24_9BASI|nr:hypothetical protein BMF94_3150 [Rhodotorula taiwanensis]